MGFLGRRSQPLPHQQGVCRSAVNSPSGVRGVKPRPIKGFLYSRGTRRPLLELVGAKLGGVAPFSPLNPPMPRCIGRGCCVVYSNSNGSDVRRARSQRHCRRRTNCSASLFYSAPRQTQGRPTSSY